MTFARVLIVSMIPIYVVLQCGSCCDDVCPSLDGWNSMINIGIRGARYVFLRWTADTSSSLYVVQHRLRNTQRYSTSIETSSIEFNITQLSPETDYEVQVCRAISTASVDDCGNCLFCISTTQAQEPPSQPLRVQVRADSSESITVLWSEPEVTNGRINSYSVVCYNERSGLNIINTTVFSVQPITEFFLEPNTTYTCSVTAYNDHGASTPHFAMGITPPVTTVPSLLLVVYANGVEYAELTTSAIQSGMLTFQHLLNSSEDARIKGLDYHFYRGEIYMTQENHCITRVSVTLVESLQRNSLRRTTEPEVLFYRNDSDLGSITVDWVNNKIYWVERQGGHQIMVGIIQANGSVEGPFCVVRFMTSDITHLAIDPVHGYLYWSDTASIYRVPLHDFHLSSTRDSCARDISSKFALINNTQLETFTVEPNEAIYFVGHNSCFDDPGATRRTNRSILGTTLNAGEIRVYTGITDPVVSSDSFDRTLFSVTSNAILAVDATQVATCPKFPPLLLIHLTESPVLVLRAYRSVKQPLPVPPGPPTNILISSTSSKANVTWMEPSFIGEFFSEGAYADWIYGVEVRAVGGPPEFEFAINTSALSVLLENLLPDTLYEVELSAYGPGGRQRTEDKLVFSTKSADSENFLLLVATETGVIGARINGSSADVIGGRLSTESNGVAYDSYTGHIYWSIEGGQGKLYMSNSTRSEGQVLFSNFRRNPFSLEFDWVARRLFWVEDGITVRGPKRIVSYSLENPQSTELFTEVNNIQATILDSLNGVLFWANESSIHAITLSGLIFEPVCYTTYASPFGFAVDAKRRRLYWLNNDAVDGHLLVSQLEYTSTFCDRNSIIVEDIAGLSFSSSSTVMAYAANNLFIGTLSTSRIYTIASDLSYVGDDQVLALGVVQLDFQSTQELTYRDMIIVSQSLQMLPGTLQPTDRQKSLLIPSVASSPPRLSDRSSSLETIIEWDGSTLRQIIQNTPVHYTLQYSISSGLQTFNVTSESTSVVLEGIPPDTAITARVTAYSLWYPSMPTQYSNISSRLALPGTVTNIRAYLYKPTRDAEDLTALVLWDEPNFVVSNYSISVFENGVELFPRPEVQKLFQPDMILYQSPNADTHYIISARDFENRVNYFLAPRTTYKLQVTAINPSGAGNPSPLYTLNVTEPNYPQNFLIVNETGVHLVGVDADLNHALPVTSHSPLVVDTISRVVYWYHESPKSIARQSLNSNSMDILPYLLLPENEVLLAMAFDWVGMELYFMSRDQTNCLKIMKVSAVNRNMLTQVAPNLIKGVSPTARIRMTVDPFVGYLHWLVVDENGTSLHLINLRNVSAGSMLVAQSRMRRQSNDVVSLNLSSALLLDPHSGNLLLSDFDSGDIVNCSVTDNICTVLIDASSLQPHQQCDGTGLPARSIALNELRLYWIGVTSSCIFAVNLDNPSNLLVISTYSATDIFTLSPGQQPLPTQDCLAPNVKQSRDRPDPRIIDTRNTSVTLSLVAPPLDDHCNSIVISFPPVIFGINVEDSDQPIPGFPIPTFDTEYIVDGLQPFTDYEIELSVSNMYTIRSSYIDLLFSSGIRFRTLEGVPLPPTGVMALVFGTADIQISWTPPSLESLKGQSQTYYIKLYSNDTCNEVIQVDDPVVLLNASVGVIPGAPQVIAVIVSNFVLNSTETPVPVTPWPLVPAPVMANRTNTSIAVMIVLADMTIYEPVTYVAVKICEILDESPESCICNDAPANFKSVNNSAQVIFHFTRLQAHTLYCLQSVANYRVVEQLKSSPEMTAGGSSSIRTNEGVPDPPVIQLRTSMENIVEWEKPNTRGTDIILYRVLAIRDGAPTARPLEFVITETEVDLSARKLTPEVVYNIHVFAKNAIGESSSSNVLMYTRLQSGLLQEISPAEIVGISVGSLLVVILCLVVILAFFLSCYFVHWRKKEPTSLSYMYGPDHELSNLRDAYRHAHANNPHYTWSRDDYVCTDEDIELLNKFPRQYLKLETFIDRGEFGEVYQGNAIDILGPETGPTPVAVKTLRKGTTYDEQRKFLSEASLMSKFNHPNIVKVLGVCVDNDPVYIIMELMPAGDLLKFLRDAKRDHGPSLLTLPEQIQIALDVANGCRYLEQQHYIHRDIAARNCLVSSKGADRVVKIGDFGLARDLYSSDYYQVEGQRKLPVRWMAPEALLQGKFTIESDIWSYGVLLWEIMTLGNQPYPGRINQEVLQYVTGGGRLDRPEKCPGKIYHLMQSCWKRYSSERPHFDQIVTVVSDFLGRVKRPGSMYYSDSDSEEGDSNLQRQSSGKLPSRTPSIRSGILSLARSGSMKLRNSFRRHGSIHRRDEHAVSQFSEEGQAYRERGPF